MSCPVHIWVPAMAAIAPAATMARHKLRSLLPSKRPEENPADHLGEMKRWSPVTGANPPASSEPATD